MELGRLIGNLGDEANGAEALAALGDLVLYARIEVAGAEHDEAPGEYVANATRRFAVLAGDEDWLALMNAIERADDPGRAALRSMLGWALSRDEAEAGGAPSACGCGGGSCGGHAGGSHGHR